jgi:phosphatidylinositol alpha-1,6-mannosyltransferase
MTTTPRLLVVTSTWPLAPNDHRTPFVRNLAVDLAARDWDIQVLAPHAAGAARRERDGRLAVARFRYLLPEHAQTLAYGAGGLINLRGTGRKWQAVPFVAAEIMAIRCAIHRFRPDIVHAHWLLPQGFAAGIAALGTGIPVVTTIHGGDVFGLTGPVYQPFKRFAIRRAAAISVNGSLTAAAAISLGASPDKIETIRFGPAHEGEVDREEAQAWRKRLPAESVILLFVGRLLPEKGPGDFIEAIARTGQKNLIGVVCGDGPMRAELEALAVRRGIAAQIYFEGWLDPAAIALRMAGADALVFPSKRSSEGWVEAQGVVLVEAMRARLPILAASSGGIPDLIEPGKTGWLFPEADVDAMSALIADFSGGRLGDVAAMVDRAYRIATTEITRDTTAASFDRLFRQVMKRQDKDRDRG